MSAGVVIDNVSKWFGTSQALDGISLEIEGGSFVTILGPSGSGKSTTLRIVGGFETPDRGRVLLDGHDISRLPPEARDVNTSFQGYALFPHMTVAENVAFGLETKKVPRPDIERRVKEALELVRLGSFGRRNVASLSGGEQQRIALARAIVNRPKVLLLDEPLSALDLKLRREMQIELKALQRSLGITFVYVTHDQEEALSMSDRIVVMNRARIEQIGAPGEVYKRPRTAFVAAFLGEANILSGTACGPGKMNGHLAIDLGGRTIDAVCDRAVPAGAKVRVSLRPESLVVGGMLNGVEHGMQGNLIDAIFLGNAWEFIVAAGEFRLKAWMPAKGMPAPPVMGSKVSVSWANDDLVVVE